MGPMQAVLQGVITIFFYAMIIAALWKLFMMAADIGEIKKLLADIRSNTAAPALKAAEVPASVQVAAIPTAAVPVATAPVAAAPPPPPVPIPAGPISLESAEALLREIEAEERALAAQPPKPVAS